jgi:hypothetical protein
MKIFLQILIGIFAVLISLWVGFITLFMLTLMAATVSGFTVPLQGYAFMTIVFLVAFGIIFSVCFVAKKIIVKLNN